MRAAPTDDLGRAVEVVNSWDTLHPEPEQIPNEEILGRFLRWIGRPDLRDALREGDLARYRALRTELRQAFDAPDAAAALEILDGLLAARPTRIRPRGDAASPLAFESAGGDPIATLAIACAAALAIEIAGAGLERLGQCSGSPCTCVYVDRSRNRRRRYCSDQCNDRVAQAAHRQRRAAR